ncbi:hypothetical protein L3X38_027258 [Prunus dulcis]|uniref:Uncharacterized protein n=1 Tax=Prunus dulcis TaxID=3755 RepID=A0AAD4YZA4_PRUDU|nr:hypothetical protein L3X38_027258 [Prunus dulcis]
MEMQQPTILQLLESCCHCNSLLCGFRLVRVHVRERICSQRARQLDRRSSPSKSQLRSTTSTSCLNSLGCLGQG